VKGQRLIEEHSLTLIPAGPHLLQAEGLTTWSRRLPTAHELGDQRQPAEEEPE
jgi:hypothetical protein